MYQMSDAFNRDTYILVEFKKLIKEFDVKTIVETGTYLGKTTNVLATLVDEVVTIEINKNYQKQAKEQCKKHENVKFLLGNSPIVLKQLLPLKGNILFFLDAHWGPYNPLIDELETIALSGMKPIIAIHDFKVPGKNFGFDAYGGQDYEWSWIAAAVEKIYGKDYQHYYNEEANGAKRGIVYIQPAK